MSFFVLIMFFTLSLPTGAKAQRPVVLTGGQDKYPLAFHIDVLEDPTRQLTIKEVASPEFEVKFIQNQTREFNPGLTKSAYWVRFQINNQTSQTGDWWLEIAALEIHEASLYYPRADGSPGFEVKEMGKAFPAAMGRESGHYFTVFRLPLSPNVKQTIYLRVYGQRLNLPLTLWSNVGFIRESQKDFIILGIYLGILLIMAGYNFILFLTLRDKSYLYFVLFLSCAFVVEILRKNLFLPVLGPSSEWLSSILVLMVVATLTFVVLLRFADSFLLSKNHAPRLRNISIGLQIGLGSTMLLHFVFGRPLLSELIWFILVLLSIALIIIMGLVTWWRGYRPARYFLLALTIQLFFTFAIFISMLGYMPTSFTEYIREIGVALTAILMSLALTDRINTIKQKGEQAEALTNQRHRELTLLNQVITATATAVELGTALESVCLELNRAFSLSTSIAFLLDEDRKTVSIVADYTEGNSSSLLGQSVPVEGNKLFKHILVYKCPLVVEDVQNDPNAVSFLKLSNLRNTVSLLVSPLLVESKVVGGFCLGSDDPRHFSSEEINLVQTVAEQVAAVFTRIQLIGNYRGLSAQYHQVQKMESIGVLAGGIAHDFNNLMTPVMGYIEMWMEKLPSDSEFTQLLENIYGAAEKATTLTQQILAFSRKQALEIKPVNLCHIIDDFKKMLERMIGEDIVMKISVASSQHMINADCSQIEQVLLNLIVNARDAMPNGGKITIELDNIFLGEKYANMQAKIIPGPYVIMTVSDTGCGMEPETLRNIFEPFFTTKEPGSGTGLGLSTVHGIIKQHGGHISADSELGKGTIFRIYLPQASESGQTEQPKPEAVSYTGTETVLVVEDEKWILDLVCMSLEKYGYHVLKSENPKKSLQIARKNRANIDLLLSDVIMPGINGRELYHKVRKLNPKIKVLYMSGYTDNIIVRSGILEKGTNYLQKPFSIEALARKVRNTLNA